MTQVCLFCGGDASEPDHAAHCDGRQGRLEAQGVVADAWEPDTHARATDPDTSHAAAWSIVDATEIQRRVYGLYRRSPAGLTDEELLAVYARTYDVNGRSLESRASPRKRRSDLTRAGVLVDSGERRPLSSGRCGVVWKVASTTVVRQYEEPCDATA